MSSNIREIKIDGMTIPFILDHDDNFINRDQESRLVLYDGDFTLDDKPHKLICYKYVMLSGREIYIAKIKEIEPKT